MWGVVLFIKYNTTGVEKMKKKIAILAVALSCALSINVPAATEKDIDDMTLEELKVEYLKLQLEYEKLKATVENGSEDTSTNEENTAEVEDESEDKTVQMNEEEFKTDIVNSYNARGVIADKYTVAELNTMTSEETVSYDEECAESERDFYEKYKNAAFTDLNIQYLCNQYINGLSKQYNAKKIWDDTQDINKFLNEFNSGYYNRAYVIVELSDYYSLPFGDVEGMRVDTAAMDSLNEAETRNKAVDQATVQKTQQLLNDIGFYCGKADGISGKRTVKSIKRFQQMYGYDPEDGMIDEELITQLETELSKK